MVVGMYLRYLPYLSVWVPRYVPATDLTLPAFQVLYPAGVLIWRDVVCSILTLLSAARVLKCMLALSPSTSDFRWLAKSAAADTDHDERRAMSDRVRVVAVYRRALSRHRAGPGPSRYLGACCLHGRAVD